MLAGDLPLPEGAKLLSSARESLAAVIESRASRLAEQAAQADAKSAGKAAAKGKK